MSLSTDIAELLAEVFEDTLLDEGIALSMTYHSAKTAAQQEYDPETGRYVDSVSSADGALWFDDGANSHWLAVI